MSTLTAIADIARDVQPGVNWQTIQPPAEQKPAGVPRRVKLTEVDAAHPEVAAAVEACRQWAGHRQGGRFPAPSLIFSGPYGTGKTMLARVILWSIVDSVKERGGLNGEMTEVPAGRFYRAEDLLLALGPNIDPETQTQSTARPGHLLGTAPLVVIDDVGGEGVIQFVAKEYQEHERHSRYFRFIDHCYTCGVSVIITTNLKTGSHECELAKHLGGRAWDRLMEMCPVGAMVGLWRVPSWRVKAGGR